MNDKCHLTSDPYSPLCTGMLEALQPQRGPGLWIYILTNRKTLDKRMVGIVVSNSKCAKCQPLLLNFCPFCGERLLTDDGKPFWDEPKCLGEPKVNMSFEQEGNPFNNALGIGTAPEQYADEA